MVALTNLVERAKTRNDCVLVVHSEFPNITSRHQISREREVKSREWTQLSRRRCPSIRADSILGRQSGKINNSARLAVAFPQSVGDTTGLSRRHLAPLVSHLISHCWLNTRRDVTLMFPTASFNQTEVHNGIKAYLI